MCYDIKAKLKSQLKRAKRKNDFKWIEELEEKLKIYTKNELLRVSGFNHPKLLIYKQNSPNKPTWASWGLIPNHTKNEKDSHFIWNKTLNARSESIFEKQSFKRAIKSQRCLVQIDGFFEHHYRNNKAYPFYIQHKNKTPLTLAGIYDNWLNPQTGDKIESFSIITTKAIGLLSEIHNNPKLKEPRIPLLLNEADEDNWLNNDNSENDLKLFFKSTLENDLMAHTVKPLKGKQSVGNSEEASTIFEYDVFNTLF